MSLRTRLALGLVALAAIGLAVAGIATHRALSGFLVDRVDDELAETFQRPAPQPRNGQRVAPETFLRELLRELPTGAYVQLRGPAGRVIEENNNYLVEQANPELPDVLEPGHHTVGSADGTRYRARTEVYANGAAITIALPLTDIEDTLDRLLTIELVVAVIVLAALAGLAWWVVHLGLRPLERMADTAGAIADGDLTQRVEDTDEKTEVGQLGVALNTMLARIEEAFAAREESEARLRRFVADASHELRTPLTSIRGYAELFRRGASQDPDDLAKTMRRIEEEAARMGVLVDDLLLLARLDQGRQLEHAAVDLTRLATDAVDDARATAPHRHIELTPNGSVTVVGDELRLRQVLANLLANACTHTPDDAAIRVSVTNGDGEAVIEVADEGPGMSAEDAAHAFDRFWRADSSRTRASGGTGLGLSIVAAIAAAHEGRAEIDTLAGRGATFRVRFPVDVRT
ncbi:MAG: sensor histidine kinase [Actinomycetota bacterium]